MPHSLEQCIFEGGVQLSLLQMTASAETNLHPGSHVRSARPRSRREQFICCHLARSAKGRAESIKYFPPPPSGCALIIYFCHSHPHSPLIGAANHCPIYCLTSRTPVRLQLILGDILNDVHMQLKICIYEVHKFCNILFANVAKL